MNMTPLEAGVAAGRLEVVHLLVTRGVALDRGRRAALVCEALRRGYQRCRRIPGRIRTGAGLRSVTAMRAVARRPSRMMVTVPSRSARAVSQHQAEIDARGGD
jgi:hypothetical protein